MSKIKVFNIIFFTILLSLFFNILFGRFLTAKISTWPPLNRWKIISPQTPIVITNTQEVRYSDGADVVAAVNAVKSKISTVVIGSGGSLTVVGGAVNLTSEGAFVTSANIFSTLGETYSVILNDGRSAKITATTIDPATGLVFFRAPLNNVSVAALGTSETLFNGEIGRAHV